MPVLHGFSGFNLTKIMFYDVLNNIWEKKFREIVIFFFIILLLHKLTSFVRPEGVGLETNGAYIPRGHVELPTTRGFFFFESDGKGVCQDHAKKSVFLG